MEDGFQILLYIAAFVIWIISSIQGAKKKAKPKRTPVSMSPTSLEQNAPEPEVATILKEKLERLRHSQQIEKKNHRNESAKKKTFLGENPYRDSIECRKRKKKEPEKRQLTIREEEAALEASAIDWTKAVIYSEILRPRF